MIPGKKKDSRLVYRDEVLM